MPQDASPPTDPPAPLDGFRGDRTYLGADHARNERRVWLAAAISCVALGLQLVGGIVFQSMALLAGGIHTAAHVAALSVAGVAYLLSRRLAKDRRFSFGAGKIGYLAAFANAVALGVTALLLAVEALNHLSGGEAAHYHEATQLAFAALAVNLVCMWLLRPPRRAPAGDRDLNLNAVHLHLAADVLVSVLAIGGLLAGDYLGWAWADPVAGLLGAGLVAHFAWSLARRSGAVLLDMNPDPQMAGEIRRRLVALEVEVLDLHLWRLGPGHQAAVAVLADPQRRSATVFRAALADLPGLSHLTVEVRSADPPAAAESPAPALTRKSASV